jgi:thiol-disulfide isomerase/thioredoxin
LLLALLSGCSLIQNDSSGSDVVSDGSTTAIDALGSDDGGHGPVDTESVSGDSGRSSQTETATIGYPAPDFSYTTLEGSDGSLAGLQGEVVLINFWASWCPPCVREMPELEQLAQDYPELNILAISIDDTEQEARDFIASGGYSFTCIFDKGWRISNLYPSDGIPYTVIIDRSGVITQMLIGTPRDPYATYLDALRAAGL